MPRFTTSPVAQIAINATRNRAASHLRTLLEFAEGQRDDQPTERTAAFNDHPNNNPELRAIEEPHIDDVANWTDLDKDEQIAFDDKLDAFLGLDVENTNDRAWLLSNG